MFLWTSEQTENLKPAGLWVPGQCGWISHLLVLESSSVPLLQENVGRGAALGLHSNTTRLFFAPSSLCFTGFSSNEGAPTKKKTENWVARRSAPAWQKFDLFYRRPTSKDKPGKNDQVQRKEIFFALLSELCHLADSDLTRSSGTAGQSWNNLPNTRSSALV